MIQINEKLLQRILQALRENNELVGKAKRYPPIQYQTEVGVLSPEEVQKNNLVLINEIESTLNQ